MKLKLLIAAGVFAIAGLIVYSQAKSPAFAPAEDFPRDALVYIRIADLPALIKLWNESKLKEKYLESANFDDFKNNHLGRKLASRWQEFNEAAGFPMDLELLGELAGNQASVALYDVGKLEFVFIAPVSDEIFAATGFAVGRDKFTPETLDGGTVVYRVSVAADRGRQRQEMIFTHTAGRFILATSEKLLAQTLENIAGGKAGNRLTDEPSFKLLSERVEAHAATVWLDQTALNDDYYFKRYWLMSGVEDLENIRAGMFDFEIQPGKLVERRRFLLNKAVEGAPIDVSEAAQILSFLPAEIPFYRLRTATPQTIGEAVEKIILDRRREPKTSRRTIPANYSSDEDDDRYSGNNYDALSGNFDEAINEEKDVGASERNEIETNFSKIFQPTDPQTILTFTQPVILPSPLFAEFRRAAVISLAAGESFDRDAFEAAISRKLSARTTISAPGANLKWETRTENNSIWRQLDLPMLGWNVSYSIEGKFLVLTDNAEDLRNLFLRRSRPTMEKQSAPFDAVTVIDFGEKEIAYRRIFERLNDRQSAGCFFANNIGSLLDSVSEVKKIEIREIRSARTLDEEITVSY